MADRETQQGDRNEPTQPSRTIDNARAIATDHSERRERLRTIGQAIRTASTNHRNLLDQSIGLAEDISSAIGTRIQKESHWKYWLDFMGQINEDFRTFGSPIDTNRVKDRARQTKELNTLKQFFSHIVFRPRRKSKRHNTAAYARKVIASVRDEYERQHRISIGPPTTELNLELHRLEKGLSKIAPSQEKPRLPVLQYHMRAVRRTLDLDNNQLDRVLWALWCTQFQGVLRAGDLIRPMTEDPRRWDPDLDTHRGRVTWHRIRGESHAEGRTRMKIQLKPIKNDPTGEKGFVKSFIIMDDPFALSAADAIQNMLRGDPSSSNPKHVPLFRHPLTKLEISYDLAAKGFKKALTTAGYPELATGLHCIRKGGATAYCEAAGEEVAGYMGLWASDARLQYFHATSNRLEKAGMKVAMEEGAELAVRPGAVGTYAGNRRH